MRLTGHTTVTIRNYLKDDCHLNDGYYDNRRLGKLVSYEQEVITMCSKGITYKKIHGHICSKGYTGTIASLRMFMQKERTHQKSLSKNETEPVEYIPRKFFLQKSDELEGWITQAMSLKVDQIDTYANGLLADIEAVKNAIQYKYNNGLAEGSVNKTNHVRT